MKAINNKLCEGCGEPIVKSGGKYHPGCRPANRKRYYNDNYKTPYQKKTKKS